MNRQLTCAASALMLVSALAFQFTACSSSEGMMEELKETGFVALYINFETGKADIKPESGAVIDQIVELMLEDDSLSLSIEGHTDNVGSAAFNKTLSENRAKAVMNAIVAKGIPKARLSAKGWGQEKPIADNKTEEGRAKNRRVEIVKK